MSSREYIGGCEQTAILESVPGSQPKQLDGGSNFTEFDNQPGVRPVLTTSMHAKNTKHNGLYKSLAATHFQDLL